ELQRAGRPRAAQRFLPSFLETYEFARCTSFAFSPCTAVSSCVFDFHRGAIALVCAHINSSENAFTSIECRNTPCISPSEYHYNEIAATKCLAPTLTDS
ncbi:MAG: hypothetical protein WA274_19840, partial [Candidatus Acidiferrales bacterium]